MRRQNLDRDVASVSDVMREVDRRHPAGAELALDAVSRQARGRERDVRHAGILARIITGTEPLGSTGAIRFTPDTPLPAALVTPVVTAPMTENTADAREREAMKKARHR